MRWNERLRHGRDALGLSRSALGARSGVPAETIRRWEDGSRRPPEAKLRALLAELKIVGAESNEILEDAGYHSEPTLFPNWRFPDYFYSADELDSVVETMPWPEFVVDNNVQVVAANRAAQALWGVDFPAERRSRSRAQMNLLAVASDNRFADRLVNWDEVIGIMASVVKGQPRDPESLDEPSAYFNEVMAEFARGDPAFLARFLKSFAAAPAREPKCRWTFRVVWMDDEFGEMRFVAMASTASEPAGLAFNDWIPVDADTWTVLEKVKSRASRASGEPAARPGQG